MIFSLNSCQKAECILKSCISKFDLNCMLKVSNFQEVLFVYHFITEFEGKSYMTQLLCRKKANFLNQKMIKGTFCKIFTLIQQNYQINHINQFEFIYLSLINGKNPKIIDQLVICLIHILTLFMNLNFGQPTFQDKVT